MLPTERFFHCAPSARLFTPTDPGIGVEAIRTLYEENGYVWLKGFLPRKDVIDFRGWVFGHMARTGLIEEERIRGMEYCPLRRRKAGRSIVV